MIERSREWDAPSSESEDAHYSGIAPLSTDAPVTQRDQRMGPTELQVDAPFIVSSDEVVEPHPWMLVAVWLSFAGASSALGYLLMTSSLAQGTDVFGTIAVWLGATLSLHYFARAMLCAIRANVLAVEIGEFNRRQRWVVSR